MEAYYFALGFNYPALPTFLPCENTNCTKPIGVNKHKNVITFLRVRFFEVYMHTAFFAQKINYFFGLTLVYILRFGLGVKSIVDFNVKMKIFVQFFFLQIVPE